MVTVREYRIEDGLDDVFHSAHQVCQSFDRNSRVIPYLKEKIRANNTRVWVGCIGNHVVALAVMEILDDRYGQLIVHCMEMDYEAAFASHIVPIIRGVVLELIQFTNTTTYERVFLLEGLMSKHRSRMVHSDIGQYAEVVGLHRVSVSELTMADAKICGQISYAAHQPRQHIECYGAYSSMSRREKFARELRSGVHGTSIASASLMMWLERRPIGMIDVVEAYYYSDQPIAWIMDVVIAPGYQGNGWGEWLVKKSMSEAYMAGYNGMGLTVTDDNTHAYRLYQRLGFKDHESLVEIVS